jgi:two-component system chemotaxis sensor kinase CheA
MDEELYQAFVTESEESITKLNNSLLTLESNPEDREAMDDIFRRAHTLKGNFGAMGFDDAATVAHAIEDLLDEVRQDRLAVTPERMDLVFDGVDCILDILHDIETQGESSVDSSDTIAAIRAATDPSEDGSATESNEAEPTAAESSSDESDDGTPNGDESDDGTPNGDESDTGGSGGDVSEAGKPNGDERARQGGSESETTVGEQVDEILASEIGTSPDAEATDGEDSPADDTSPAARARERIDPEELSAVDELYHVLVTLDGGDMKSVDGGLFVGGIPDSVSVLAAEPPLDAIDAGEFDTRFELFVSGLGAEATAETFADLWAVEEAAVTDVSAVAGGRVDSGESGSEPAEFGPENGFEPATPTDDAGASDGANDAGDAEGDAGDAGGRPDGDTDAAGGESEDGRGGRGRDESEDDTRSISAVKSVRVDVEQLDELHELVEQLVTSRIKLRQAVDDADAGSSDALDELDKISSSLQGTVMDMRLIPLKKVFNKFPRLVRDLARSEDKRVNFEVTGQDIELDRTILDEISDPLMHVLRNAVDHGIEPPAERVAAGKPETGTVELRAEREHDTVVVTVSDDGGGLAVEDIAEKAVQQGLASRPELDSLPDEEVFDYIFHPGFSTNEEITDVSGRGVGMDVVKTTVESLDGSVSVSSTPGEGTDIRIRLPVSVAIIKVLFVQVADRQFGVPIKYIDEIGRLGEVERINGTAVVVHEEQIFPLIGLRDALGVTDAPVEEPMVVRIRPSDRQVALRCDSVTRQEEVVVTPLQGPLSGSQGLSGTAVIGDGNVIPILDVASLSLPEGGDRLLRAGPAAGGGEGVAD